MTLEQITKLLSLGENQRIEYKSSIHDFDVLGKIVCGFLNSSGGYLICGVNERGKVIGIDDSYDSIHRLEQYLIENISPKAFVAVQVEDLEKKLAISIEVPAGSDVPYAFKDVIYIRAGELTQVANAQTIRDIVMRHQIEPERWEHRFSLADSEDDIDVREVHSAVSDAGTVRRVLFRDEKIISMVLEDLSVARYGRLTNGGDVLFTTNPAIRLPQTRIRAMRYSSDKTSDKFSDMKSFEGPLHQIFEDAFSFIIRNTSSISRFIKGSPKRLDAPLYPEEAVREALINALAHRDYSATSGGVSIHIYPHRLEIWNSGAFPKGVTAQSLLIGQISILRNPDIAHVLYLRGLMEKAGRGSVLMVQKCLENGLPSPFWKSDPQLGVTVTFPAPEVTPEVTPEVMKLLKHLTGEMSRRDLQDAIGLRDAEHFRTSYINPALEIKAIEMTIPEKPTSSKQKYSISTVGEQILATCSDKAEV